ncbi:MAG: hypothetical protein IKP02_00610 [Paludibacteraceae bacterium]|nr:hypothetical protein [Paludibacteraceae bacterium]
MQHRFFLLIALMCTLVPLAWAEGTPVMRFVPVAGDESEVALNTLQKVVFTQDSVVLIAAKDGAQTPMYKYNYQAIVFTESSSPERLDEVKSKELRVKSEKFIKDGQLYILYEGTMYDVRGRKVEIKN